MNHSASRALLLEVRLSVGLGVGFGTRHLVLTFDDAL